MSHTATLSRSPSPCRFLFVRSVDRLCFKGTVQGARVSLPPIIGSSIRLASDATIAMALSSLATIVRTPKIVKVEKPTDNEKANAKSNLFAGTRDKCSGCTKTVYPLEKVTVNGMAYHKSCFKCSHGGCTISPSNYIAHEGKLYCKHHHIQLFKEKGNYSQLETERQKSNAVAMKLGASLEIAAES
ncbi:LIM domain-containing protein WLIM1, partial [Cucurbita argyrosperma subsp. sororia]